MQLPCESINSFKKDWELVNFCEFDKYATKSYCAIHDVDESLNLGDITKVDETKLKPFNMICGGSPCQDFSVAGKQKGSVWTCKDCGHEYNPLTVHWSERAKCPNCNSENIEKTRSSLLVEYLRVIRANKPNFRIYENVKNIVGRQFKDTTFKLFTDELEEYGYNVYWKVLNAKNYGIPQNRERVYLIFIKKDLDNGKFKFPEPFDNGIRLKDILEDVVDQKYYVDNNRVEELISKAKESPYVNKNANFEPIDGTSSYAIRSQEFVRTGFTEESSTLAARDYKDPHCVVVKQPKVECIGNVNPSNKGMNGNVFDENGLAPTLTTNKGEGNKIAIRQATKKGYIECEIGGVADLSYQDSKTRRGRVQDGGNICPTLTATETGVCRIEYIEGKPKERFFRQALDTFDESDAEYGDTIDAFNKRVNKSGCSPTLTTRPEGFKTAILPVTNNLRVRKLTPKECFRLMGFSDENFEAAYDVGISNSQLYKQAGNSIVVDVLYYIFVELYKAMPYLFDDLRLISFFSGIGAFEVALDRLYKGINSGNFTNSQAD